MMDSICFKAIGIIHSPYKTLENMPIQPSAAKDVAGTIEVFPEFVRGLDDLEGFSHIYLIYQFHRSKAWRLKVIPFLDHVERGVFATRAPARPNAIGLSVVKLLKREANRLQVENIDVLDGTPLLDIKPFIPEMNATGRCRTGWFSKHKKSLKEKKSDNRFNSGE